MLYCKNIFSACKDEVSGKIMHEGIYKKNVKRNMIHKSQIYSLLFSY